MNIDPELVIEAVSETAKSAWWIAKQPVIWLLLVVTAWLSAKDD